MNSEIMSVATSSENPKAFSMLGITPLGAELARVALKTSRPASMV
jgi:hypothetical protein